MLPSFNLEWRNKSFTFLAPKLWNSLPTYVRNAKDNFTFLSFKEAGFKIDFRMVILNYFFYFQWFPFHAYVLMSFYHS